MAFKFTHSGPVRVQDDSSELLFLEALAAPHHHLGTHEASGIWRDDFVAGVDRIVCAVTRGRVTELFSITAHAASMQFQIVDRGLTGVRLDGSWVGLQVSFVVSAAALNDISSKGETFTLSDDEVTSRFIKAGAITEVKLATRSVGATKLKDRAVPERALKTDSVGSRALQDGAVGAEQLEDGSVGVEKLAPNTQVALGTDKANNDASSINAELWRFALEVGEKDDSATLPNPGETGKTANTKMVRKALDAVTGRLLYFYSFPVGVSAIAVPSRATRAFYSISSGGGGGGGGGTGGASGGASGSHGLITTLTFPGAVPISALGGRGGTIVWPPHPVQAGAHGGRPANFRGGPGQEGLLIENYYSLSSLSGTVSITVGAGGAGGAGPSSSHFSGEQGGSGWCKIWWYS